MKKKIGFMLVLLSVAVPLIGSSIMDAEAQRRGRGGIDYELRELTRAIRTLTGQVRILSEEVSELNRYHRDGSNDRGPGNNFICVVTISGNTYQGFGRNKLEAKSNAEAQCAEKLKEYDYHCTSRSYSKLNCEELR